MNPIKLINCPLCGSSDIAIEKSMYSRSGKFIAKSENRTEWIVKCNDCCAITDISHSRVQAISRWNMKNLNETCYTIQGPSTTDPEPWWALATAIYRTAFEDYKDALRRKQETGGRGGIEGDHWLIKQSSAAKRAAREQIPYDQWRDKMGCSHCTATEQECEHKFSYPWIKFKNGKAQDCFLGHDKELTRDKNGKIDWDAFISKQRRKNY